MRTIPKRKKNPIGKVTLRPAMDADASFARDAHNAAFHDVVVKQFGSWTKDKQDHYFELSWNSAKMTIIELDGAPCGYARIDDFSMEIRIQQLVVSPQFQRRGVGSYVLKQLQDKAHQHNKLLTLRVLHKNQAIKLYARLGFKTTIKIGRAHV